jgi:hypothetical protein
MVTTRNRASKTSGDSDKDSPRADANKGTKRKRKTSTVDQVEDVDIENQPDKSRARLESEKEAQEELSCQQPTLEETAICSCRHDVMKCIGILPSLPIMNQYYDSDDSESDLEDYSHTVLPIVDRNSNKPQGAES